MQSLSLSQSPSHLRFSTKSLEHRTQIQQQISPSRYLQSHRFCFVSPFRQNSWLSFYAVVSSISSVPTTSWHRCKTLPLEANEILVAVCIRITVSLARTERKGGLGICIVAQVGKGRQRHYETGRLQSLGAQSRCSRIRRRHRCVEKGRCFSISRVAWTRRQGRRRSRRELRIRIVTVVYTVFSQSYAARYRFNSTGKKADQIPFAVRIAVTISLTAGSRQVRRKNFKK